MKQLKFTLALLLAMTTLVFSACKKDKDDDPQAGEKQLVITQGARSIQPDQQLSYSANFVSTDGSTSAATGLSWSSSNTSVATIGGSGAVAVVGLGSTNITATVSEGGKTYTASVPLAISAPSVFAVVPSAIIWEASGSMQLEPVFLGINAPSSYTYSSSNSSIASVNSTGLVSFHSVGSCEIQVTASSYPNNPVVVPVMVVGPPTVSLPITRIQVNPSSVDLFRQESAQLSATAYNLSGQVTANFSWSSSDASLVSVDANGRITANGIGNAYVYASAQGISGQAEVYVYPDTVIEVTPLIASIPAGRTKQFTAKAYNIRTGALLTGITQFDWLIPSYGFPMFDFATVNSSGLVSVNSNAMVGNMTFVAASLPSNPEIGGVAIVQVSLCDCGNGNAAVANINVQGPISLSLFSNPFGQVNATATNSTGATVANPELRYCSEDQSVAIVDELTGEVTAAGPGSTIITVCSGGFAEATTTVNVAF